MSARRIASALGNFAASLFYVVALAALMEREERAIDGMPRRARRGGR